MEKRKLTRQELGKLGGVALLERHGREHMRLVGRKGGDVTVRLYGREHMSRLGILSGESKRRSKLRQALATEEPAAG